MENTDKWHEFVPVKHAQAHSDGKSVRAQRIRGKPHEWFTKIPNELLCKDLPNEYGVDRIVLIVYALIGRNQTWDDRSFLTVGMVMSACQYKQSARKTHVFDEIIKSLFFLEASNYIALPSFDPAKLKYNDCLEIKLISEYFAPEHEFTKLYWSDFDKITQRASTVSKEFALTVFLYVRKHIGNSGGSKHKYRPKAFWGSLDETSAQLGIGRNSVSQCLSFLSDAKDAPLEKYNLGYMPKHVNGTIRKYPTIYVLNNDGGLTEIFRAQKVLWEEYAIKKE